MVMCDQLQECPPISTPQMGTPGERRELTPIQNVQVWPPTLHLYQYDLLFTVVVLLDSCDCEEFGMPLAKKINQMNIEFDRQRQRQGTGSSGSSSVSPQNEKSPDEVPVANCPEFLAKYPFSKESPYYNSNLLLSSLYQERIERNPHLRHNPS